MKNLKKVTKKNPASTFAVIIGALVGIATLFMEQSTFLGVSTEIVKYVGFGIAVLTFLTTYFDANLNKN